MYAACFVGAVCLAFRPITVPEAMLWDDLVRPPFRDAFLQPSAWTGWIYAMLAKRTIGLFRLSEFSLRLPALMAGACYLALLPRRALLLIAAVLPVALGAFSTAASLSLALALAVAALRLPLLWGVAVACSPPVMLPLAAASAVRGLRTFEKVAIPAIVIAFLLLIVPLSHAAWPARPPVGSREVATVRTVLSPSRGGNLRVAAVPVLLPVVRFYKDRYRERGWRVSPF
jgi:hypothetical protein